MRKLIVASMLSMLSMPAFAQSIDPAAANAACIQKLGQELQEGLQMRVMIIQLQKQVQDLQAQLAKAQKK